MGQDVQKQSFRPLAFGRHHLGRSVALPDEVMQQDIARARHAEDVEGEERDADPVRDLKGLVRQERIEGGRQNNDRKEDREPSRGLLASGEEQGTERRGE